MRYVSRTKKNNYKLVKLKTVRFNIVNEIISVYDNGDDPEKVLKLMQDVNCNFNILDARNW